MHFVALRQLYCYLRETPDEGIYYWRKMLHLDLPIDLEPFTKDSDIYEPETRTQNNSKSTRATVDSDYANDTNHRHSVTGIAIKEAGGAVFYKTNFQSTVVLSSTEAEFIAACEVAIVILYIRSLLDDINIKQDEATILYEDNQSALLMENLGQPTKRTRCMDTKHFALQQWVGLDLLKLKRIDTSDNESDLITKNLGRILFYRHVEYLMGKIIPECMRQTT